ncbi:MAG: S41 family peptidase [Treponema sp.]|nr:S41 family peptidase [Treponema sp.]
MKKNLLLFAFIALLSLGCQKFPQLLGPSDFLDTDNPGWETAFRGFWVGMNYNYVFWDIDPTNWDDIYTAFRPRFAALDASGLNAQEKFKQARQYFVEMTENLIDGHFVLMLEGDLQGISPSMQRFFRQFGACFYDDSTWEASGVLRSEIIEGDYSYATHFHNLLTTNHLRSGALRVQAPNVGGSEYINNFNAIVGRIPLPGNTEYSILYMHFSDFHWTEILRRVNAGATSYYSQAAAVFTYFYENLHNQDVKGVIVDLRGNGGGRISDLSLLWGQMFSAQTHKIGYTRQMMGEGRLHFAPLIPFTILNTSQTRRNLTVPLVLLTNNFSVSAAEMSALFVRSLPNGFLVGSSTWGGTGALISNYVFNAGQFQTHKIQLAYTASVQTLDLNRRSFEGRGIPPDFYVPFNYQQFSSGVDARIKKAIEVITNNQ